MSAKSVVQYLLLAAAVAICAWQLSFQYQGQFAQGSYRSLAKIRQVVGPHDLLLIQRGTTMFNEQVVPSLNLYFGIPVFQIGSAVDLERFHGEFSTLFTHYRAVYLLSQRHVGKVVGGLEHVKDVMFSKGFYGTAHGIPEKYAEHRFRLFLYRLNLPVFRTEKIRIRQLVFKPAAILSGMTGDGWTTGCAHLQRPLALGAPFRYLSIDLHGWRPFWNDVARVKPVVRINGKRIAFLHNIGKGYLFRLDGISRINRMSICSSTFVPKQLGINNDTRSLGLDIRQLVFW